MKFGVLVFNEILIYNKCPSVLKSKNFSSNIHQIIISINKNNFEIEVLVLLQVLHEIYKN